MLLICIPLFVQTETIPVPVDLTIWGGLSLAILFRAVVVPALLMFGILKPENKKTIGAILGTAGLLVGAIYSVFAADLTDPMTIFKNLAAGAFAGIGAVGLHSTQKNLTEWLARRKEE